ncbi:MULTISPECIES: sigma-70 family RNA polymerase sigma factor [Anaerotruncus]|uniref:sigma-70 family RNA polymerase sigma factor n=1 Tax=Anaerotruncus TaxID=244127 RepID=UPI0008297EB2|nr:MULTISPECIES: sigma-70 family RNA polymerase sigma factor [Anaerotruncus]RGX51740.1 sigma-70 family RNA polymerase sigma factor [Anaerotruncus sp. AF02-27]
MNPVIECAASKREQTISQNIGLVHSCAHRFKGRGIEYDDLFQAGCMGLCKAADAFDEERGVRFSTYAVPVILGEMRRLFRDGGAVKVSRSIKELSMKIARQRETLSNVLGREPSVSELSEAMDLPEEQVVEALCASAPPISLTESDDDGGGQIDLPVDSPEDLLSDIISLKQVVGSLEPNDRKLIVLRYFSGMTQVQTAARLGMTQVQVSRREKKILTALRAELTG